MSLPSEPWITLAVTDLNDYLAGPYGSALQTAALAAGQANPWTNVSTDIINQIRSAIRGGCLKNMTPILVSQTPLTIPPDLKSHAMALIVERLQQRLGGAGLKLGTDAIEKSADIARRYIERIQEGKATVTAPPDPLTPDDQQRGTPTTVVRADCRQFSRRSLRGL